MHAYNLKPLMCGNVLLEGQSRGKPLFKQLMQIPLLIALLCTVVCRIVRRLLILVHKWPKEK